MVKPAWKKLESWLLIAASGLAIEAINFLIHGGAAAFFPPQYSALIVTALSVISGGLLAYFMNLRHKAYADIGVADPNASDGAAAPVQSLAQAANVLQGKAP